MPTTKPRISAVLDPEDYAVIKALADLNGQSASSVVAQVVHDVVPMLANVVRAGQAFKAAQEGVRGDIRDAFAEADQIVGPEIQRLQADILDRLSDIAAIADEPEDPRRVTRGSATPTPPHHHPVPKGRDS